MNAAHSDDVPLGDLALRAGAVAVEALWLVEAERRATSYAPEQGARVRKLAAAADARVKVARRLTAPSLDAVVAALLRDAITLRIAAAAAARGEPEDAPANVDAALALLPEADRASVASALTPTDRLAFESLSREDLGQTLGALRRAERALRGVVEPRSLAYIRGTRVGRTGTLALVLAWLLVAGGRAWLGPSNVALHAPVSIHGTADKPNELVDGVTDTLHPVGIRGVDPSVTIDLVGPCDIQKVRVYNRQDGGFDASLPLDLETSLDGFAWTTLVRRRDHFSVWTESLGGVRTRYVRLRSETRFLALNEIEIYGRYP